MLIFVCCFQVTLSQRLREQVKQLERQREEEQLERARVVNALTQRLEESQKQCAQLLQTSEQTRPHVDSNHIFNMTEQL